MGLEKYSWYNATDRTYLSDKHAGALLGIKKGFFSSGIVALFILPKKLIRDLERDNGGKLSRSDLEELEHEHKIKQHLKNVSQISLRDLRYVEVSRYDISKADETLSLDGGQHLAVLCDIPRSIPKDDDQIDNIVKDVYKTKVKFENKFY